MTCFPTKKGKRETLQPASTDKKSYTRKLLTLTFAVFRHMKRWEMKEKGE